MRSGWSRRLAVAVCSGVVATSVAVPAAEADSAPPDASTPSSQAAAPPPRTDAGVTRARVSQPQEQAAADGELVSRRTAYSRTYRTSDGSLRTVLGALPLNFPDTSGRLAPIDTTLVPAGEQAPGSAVPAAGSAFVTKAGPAVLSVPASGSGAVRVASAADGSWVQTALDGAAGTAEVAGSTATVDEALQGVDVGWTSTLGGVKETLTLASPAAASSFTFALSASAGLTPVLTDAGGVEMRTPAGKVVWVLPAPFMDDAAGAHSDAVRYTLADDPAGGWTLAMTADRAWLADPSRRFPVVVDPTVLLSAGGSGNSQDLACEIRSSTPSTGYCSAADFAVGINAAGTSRAVVKFPQLNQVVPANAIVATAELELPVVADEGSGTQAVQARPLTEPFTSAATWDSPDGTIAWAGGAGASGSSSSTAVVQRTLSSSPVGTTVVMPVSDLTRRWLTGLTPNYGLLLKSADETVLRRASLAGLSSTCTASSCGSRLQVSYVERLGNYDGSQFHDTELTDTSSLRVNLTTGNAVLTEQELGVARTWNSKRVERVGQIGRGWNWGEGRDSRAWVQTGDRSIRYYAPDGAMYMFYRNLDGSYQSPPGLTATATNHGGGNISIFFARSNQTLSFGPGYGQLLSSKDRNGNTTSYAYSSVLAPKDDVPFTTTVTDPAGRVLTATNDGTFVTQISDAASRTAKYSYTATTGAVDLLASVTNADGGVTKYEYDGHGRIKRITTPAGRVMRLAYGSGNRLTSLTRVSDPAGDGGLGTGPTTTFDYTPIVADGTSLNPITPDARGTTVVTDPRGSVTTYTHDAFARITRVLDALGRHRDSDYGLDNNVTAAYDASSTSAKGDATTYSYDGKVNPTKETGPTGVTSSATYANTSQPHQPDTSTDEQGNTTAYTYDTAGNLTKAEDTTSGSTTTYGVYGNAGVEACGGRTGQTGQVCTETDGRGHTTRNTYDSQGNLASVTPPAPLGATRYTHDALGRVVTVTDGKGQTTTTRYDGAGRTVEVLYDGTTTCAASTCVSYSYDGDGNQLSSTDGGGTISYRYDLLGRQTGKTPPGQSEQVLTYDSADNLTSISEPGGTTTYRYNAVNQLIDLAEPGGSCTASPTVRCTTFGYDDNGARTSTTYPTTPATVMTTTPYVSGRVSRIRAVTGTGTGAVVQSDVAYTYTRAAGTGDAALTRTRTDRTPGTFEGRTTSYGYDSRNQLTSAVETDSAGATTGSWKYAYDLAGNRTSATMSPTDTDTYTYNAANQLTARDGSSTGWAYDANGNETSAVVFGDKDRTTTVNAKDQYTNFKIGTTNNAASYLGAGQAERTVMGPTTSTHSPTGIAASTRNSVTNHYIHDPNGTLVALRTGGASYYYLFDGLGSVTGLVDAAGSKVNSYSYDPYGISLGKSETVDNSFEYTGGWLDGFTGLYKLGIRYYDPTLGRFTQQDPTGQDPHYTYAGGSPTTRTDRTGAAWEDVLNLASDPEVRRAALNFAQNRINRYATTGTASYKEARKQLQRQASRELRNLRRGGWRQLGRRAGPTGFVNPTLCLDKPRHRLCR